MRVRFLDADDIRIRFEAACVKLGEGEARRAFSMALNKEGRKSFTQMRRALSQQSSIPRGAVNAAMRFQTASRATLSTVTAGSGRSLPLSFFGAKQFAYGVRAKIWGKAQTFRSAFVVKRYGGGVFKRTSKARFPIEQLWGPSVPKEMLRDQAYDAWKDQHPRILTESSRLIALMLSGAPFRGGAGAAKPPWGGGAGRSPIFNQRYARPPQPDIRVFFIVSFFRFVLNRLR